MNYSRALRRPPSPGQCGPSLHRVGNETAFQKTRQLMPGGRAVARACRRSRGRGRPGGTLGGLAVGDSGPLHGPDRRAPKTCKYLGPNQALHSPPLHSVPPRAPRHRCRSGIYNADSTPTQLRRTHSLSLALAFAPPAKEARTLLLRDRSNHPLVLQNLLSSWTFLRIFGKDPLDEVAHL